MARCTPLPMFQANARALASGCRRLRPATIHGYNGNDTQLPQHRDKELQVRVAHMHIRQQLSPVADEQVRRAVTGNVHLDGGMSKHISAHARGNRTSMSKTDVGRNEHAGCTWGTLMVCGSKHAQTGSTHTTTSGPTPQPAVPVEKGKGGDGGVAHAPTPPAPAASPARH
jgi:hypothetical protein